MEWSPGQQRAHDAVRKWLAGPITKDNQVFRLFGYAGTGKTTIARALSEEFGKIKYAAFTGKAARVMRSKGCVDATTIHRLIYIPTDQAHRILETLKAKLAALPEDADPEERKELERKYELAKEDARRPSFTKNAESEVANADLVVIDECSMIDERIALDLLSFDTPILALGDPAQLPPVKGAGYFTNGKPDIVLDEIHRQARDNPIIEMSRRIRCGEKLPPGRYGDSLVMKGRPDESLVLEADQIITGRNASRRYANRRVRNLLGYDHSMFPVDGDRLVCLRNDHEVGLLNGGLWQCVGDAQETEFDQVVMTIRDPEDDCQLDVMAHSHHFQGREDELAWWDRKEAQEFDYGYALTCHKAQGSQWDHVFVFDESWCFRANARQWLYTAVTRAAERVTIIQQQ